MKSSQDFLKAAIRIQDERAKEYEKEGGERSMGKIVTIFNLHHGTNLTEAQGWHFMEILKNVRLFNAPSFHFDSALDGVSYSSLKAEAKARES